MGKAAKRNRLARQADGHEPRPGDLLPGSIHPKTRQASIPRRANFWRELPGRRVACDLCYRACVLAPGEVGWCKVRRNDGGALRLPDHGVLTNFQVERLDHSFWRCWGKAVWASGMSCTAACSFCSSTRIAWSPHKLPWVGHERHVATSAGHAYARAVLHPSAIPAIAEEWGCTGLYLGANEPTVTYEWSLDAARVAKEAGLFVNLDTNCFTTPAAVAALAPHIDMAFLGLKGHLDEGFYAKRMRAEGAVPHVKAAALAWQEAGVHIGVCDVLTPPHWLPDDAEAEELMNRCYDWIASNLGELTPLDLMPMVKPMREYPDGYQPLLPRGATILDQHRYLARVDLAEAVARECGLKYVHRFDHARHTCHHCGAVLLDRLKREDFVLNVGTDGRCGSCGGQTPIVGISREEYAELQRETATAGAA